MAPLSRGTRNRDASGLRGRSGARGRGTGRGSIKRPNSRQKPTFLSTRVEELSGGSSDENENLTIQEKQDAESDFDDISSEEDAISSRISIKPYNALLQSLSTNASRGQPLRKKRRVSQEEGQDATPTVPEPFDPSENRDEDLDLVEELEEAGDDTLGEVADLDSEEENAARKL